MVDAPVGLGAHLLLVRARTASRTGSRQSAAVADTVHVGEPGRQSLLHGTVARSAMSLAPDHA